MCQVGSKRLATNMPGNAGHFYSRLRSLLSKRKISRYSQTSVTSRPKAPYHSMYFGAAWRTPFSMKSKSRTRFKAATITTTTENPIPSKPEPNSGS